MKTARQAEHLGYDIETVRIETVTMNKLRDGDIPFGRKGGEQIERWKTKPILWRRNLVRAESLSSERSFPSTKTLPREACARPPITYSKRRLAAARRPHQRRPIRQAAPRNSRHAKPGLQPCPRGRASTSFLF